MSDNNIKYKDVIELTRELVKINSENPNTTELGVQNFLIKKIAKMGFEFDIIPFETDRNNVIARFPPLRKAKNVGYRYVMFSGHMDTVPGYTITNSAEAPVKNNKIWGRGTCDMKGGIASFLTAIKEFIKHNALEDSNNLTKVKRGICIALTVDEEMGAEGAKKLKYYSKINNEFWVDLCILCEPTSLNPMIGHKGIVWFIIDFKGKAAHAASPFLGKNSIEMAAKFIINLDRLKKDLKNRHVPEYPMISPPTLSVGIIKGGNKTNVVPNECHLEIDRRLIPGETGESALDEIKTIAQEIGLLDHMQFKPIKPGGAYIIPDGIENVYYKEILKITKKYRLNSFYEMKFMNGYTEADPYFTKFQIPVIILGPGGMGKAHSSDEYVEISQLINATEIYYEILKKYVLKEKF